MALFNFETEDERTGALVSIVALAGSFFVGKQVGYKRGYDDGYDDASIAWAERMEKQKRKMIKQMNYNAKHSKEDNE